MKYRTHSALRSGAVAFAVASLILMPALASAKENKDRDEWRKEMKEQFKEWKEERKEQREEWRKEFKERWGPGQGLHLGWYKTWPWWKSHPTTTSENDNDAPDIDDLEASSVRARSAVISWETDELARSTVYYSTDPSVDPASDRTERAIERGWLTDHEVAISGLSPDTAYHAFVVSKDIRGNTATSSKISFTTR